MKLVVLDGHTLNPGDLDWQPLAALGDLTVYPRTSPDAIVERIGDADIILTNKTPISAGTLEHCPNLRYIGVLATGFNIIDTRAAAARGIVVTNIPGYSTQAVAQMTFALILELCNHVQKHSDSVMRGDWNRAEDFCYWNEPLTELAGMTLGLIGFGQIGRQVARLAAAFDLRVLAAVRDPAAVSDAGSVELTDLPTVIRQADIISLHVPQTEETTGMINAERLSRMKRGAWLINTARGGLIEDIAVRDALVSGQLGAYAADVLSIEPMPEEHPLTGAPNLLLTPHIAWAPQQTRRRLMQIAADNIKAYRHGRIQNQVN
ncbi:MAG: D-2-hydroxyacid dehydrogenase [Eubacteriales bacterium]|nr:D-2-hydroxyacid dehydrogenase [Eubacteriales bacterium]